MNKTIFFVIFTVFFTIFILSSVSAGFTLIDKRLTVQPVQIRSFDNLTISNPNLTLHEDAADKIWSQAGIDVKFLPTVIFYNDTLAQGVSTDFPIDMYNFQSMSQLSGYSWSSDNPNMTNVVRLFFVKDIDDIAGNLGYSLQAGLRIGIGDSVIIDSATACSVADSAFTTYGTYLDVIAHELGHSLGLYHDTLGAGNLTNLMSSPHTAPTTLSNIYPHGTNLTQLTGTIGGVQWGDDSNPETLGYQIDRARRMPIAVNLSAAEQYYYSAIPNIVLLAPLNSTNITTSLTSFNATFTEDFNLTNVTLYVWNSTNSIINQTTANITGTSNYSNISFTFTSSGNFSWNYYLCDASYNCVWNSTNRTISYSVQSELDTTAPNIVLLAPLNSTNITTSLTSFNATFTEDFNLTNVTLYVWNSTNSIINQTTANITGTSNYSNISFTLPNNGVFKWNYLVSDNSSNSAWASANYTLNYSTQSQGDYRYIDTGASVQNVNACGTLNTTGAVYTLDNSVASNTTCFQIQSNNITLNGAGYTINYSVNGSFGHGINITGYNDFTIKNAIIRELNSTGSNKYAIYIHSNSDNASVINTSVYTIGSTSNAIYISSLSDYSRIIDVIINTTGAAAYGLIIGNGFATSEGIVVNNVTIYSSYYGLGTAISANNGILRNISISNIFINSSTNHAVRLSSVSTSGARINLTFINGIFASASGKGDVEISGNTSSGIWNFTNVTRINRTPILLNWSGDSNGTANIMYYFDVNISDFITNYAIEGANVSAWDIDGNFIFSKISDGYGSIPTQILRSYSMNYTPSTGLITKYFSNYSINVTNSSYNPYTNNNFNLTTNSLLNISLILTGTDIVFPIFTNFIDNSNILISGEGIATFNSTISNTNGTVYLEINGSNYTAINLTNNVYNASVLGLTNGTYLYKWIAFGNGTLNNLNSSYTISYNVNKTDQIPPSITLMSPNYTRYHNPSSINFNLLSNENLSSCLFSFNNWVTNYSMTINSTLNGANYTNYSFPNYFYIQYTANFSCADTSNNFNNTLSTSFEITMPSMCGNGIVEPGEVCDGNTLSGLNGFTCTNVSVGFTSGTLGCNSNCLNYNVSQCVRGGNRINSTTCNQADVISAIGNASNGDTVIVPEGNCNWSAPGYNLAISAAVVINDKSIIFQGAGMNLTNITLVNATTSGDAALVFNTSTGTPVRITGFTFSGQGNHSYVYIYGNSKNFRIDHISNKLDSITANNPARLIVVDKGYNYGLIDHIYTDDSIANGGITLRQEDTSANVSGNTAWLRPLELGSIRSVYVEDSIFYSNGSSLGFASDSDNGGRTTYRSNKFINVTWGSHGAQSSNGRGIFSFEIYNNTFISGTTQFIQSIWPRGGTGVIYNNNFSGIWNTGNNAHAIAVDNPRSVSFYTYFGSMCNATSNNQWDTNEDGTGYVCLDQIGRSTGNPKNQILIPLYEWNNWQNETLDINVTVINPPSTLQILESRDFYNDVQMPGYTPLPYPHYLQNLDYELDTTVPTVVLLAPLNSTNITTSLTSFNATFTDNVFLANATLYVWNSTNSIINQTTANITGTSNYSNISFTLPNNGVFKWNYLVSDNSSNSAWASANYTLNYSTQSQGDYRYIDTGASVQNVNACGTLNTTGAVYTLTQNVESNGSCFTIDRSNITLNGANYNINYSVDGVLGYGINISNVNNITLNNIFVREANTSTSSKFGISVLTSIGSSFSNLSIYTSGTSSQAFVFSGATNSTLKNISITTTGSLSTGIYFSSTSKTIYVHNSSIVTGNANGFRADSTASEVFIYGTKIISTGASRNALSITSSVSATTKNFTVVDSSLNSTSSGRGDLLIDIANKNVIINLTNVTRSDGSNIVVDWTVGSNGTLYNHWYTEFNVSDINTNASITSANVTLRNNIGNLAFSDLTDSNGRIYRKAVLSYIRNDSTGNGASTEYYSNYTLNITNPFYSTYTNSSINLTSNLFLNVKLNSSGIDSIYPSFSQYYDNNGTINGTGLAEFNVTLTNTNGTVLLMINNTNYTSSNISANIFNVSLVLLNGTYTYQWIAWGNGSSANFNVSDSRTYTLNNTLTPDISAPIILAGTSSYVNTSFTTFNITIITDEIATCKYSTNPGVAYYSMPYTFTNTGSTTHSTNISGYYNGQNLTYYARCSDTSSNNNTQDFYINFIISYANCSASNIRCVSKSPGLLQEHSTVQSCANNASAGDVCFIFSGYYNETVATNVSGNSTAYVNFTGSYNSSVRSFTLTRSLFVTIQNLEIWNNISGLDGILLTNTSNINIFDNYIHHTGNAGIEMMRIGSTPNSTSNYTYIKNNIINWAGSTTNVGGTGIDVYGNNNLIEGNDISHINDYTRVHGMYNVLRNNTFHDSDNVLDFGASPGAIHYDGMQTWGDMTNKLKFLLMENNRFDNTTEELDNIHFALFQNYEYPYANSSHAILRYNLARYVSSFASADINVPHVKVYSNTILNNAVNNSTGQINSWAIAGFSGNSSYGKIINNIFYNTTKNSGHVYWPTDESSSVGFNASNNLAYNPECGSSCLWSSHFNSEPNAIRNEHPLFVENYTNFTLQSDSPAINSGGRLTFVEIADSGTGTNLYVNDSAVFQDGWAGIEPDWIAVGNVSNIVQISSIDYDLNIITLESSISRFDGDSIYLYKDSTGKRVLYGDAPDIGAFEFVSADYVSDSEVPNLVLLAPLNSTNITTSLTSFNATFTDNVFLANVTLYVWNSTNSIINQTTSNITGTSNYSNISFTLPNNGVFKWNYLVSDNSSNIAWASANFTLTYDSFGPAINIIYPANTSYTVNVSTINYTCSEQGYSWHSVNSGQTNSSVNSCGNNFTNVISTEGTNNWIVYANDSLGNLNSTTVTFIKDTVYPAFSDYRDNSGVLIDSGKATFNVTIANTNGTVKLQIGGTNYTVRNLTSNVYNTTITLSSPGTYTYYWYAYGNGALHNFNSSGSRTYVVDESEEETNSNSGGGGGATSSNIRVITYTPLQNQFVAGYSREIRKGDKIKFSFANENHSLTLNKINSNTIEITINSTPQTAILTVGQERLFNLNNDSHYDLLVKVNSIEEDLADITIKQVHELIVSDNSENENQGTSILNPEVEKGENDLIRYYKYWWIGIILIVAGVIYFVKRSYYKNKWN